jgi:hypothetical protein
MRETQRLPLSPTTSPPRARNWPFEPASRGLVVSGPA